MNKSDLKDGMMLKLRNDNIYSLLHGNLLELSLDYTYKIIASMDDYDNEFKNCNVNLDDSYAMDIMKIYDKDVKELWERDEVDWDKVPFGSKVICWNNDDNKFEGKFLGYDEGTNTYIVFVSVDRLTEWDCCELLEESTETLTYKEMNDCIEEICNRHYKKNETCHGCAVFDSNNYCNKSVLIDENFTITRK